MAIPVSLRRGGEVVGIIEGMSVPGGKVVIVEDDPLLVRAYHEALTAKGFEVETFFNAEDAYSAIREMRQKPGMILTDIMMPKMNGLQFLEKLQESPVLRKIPVIVMTSLSQVEHAEKARSLGAVAYLVKDQHTMKEMVEKVEEFTGPGLVDAPLETGVVDRDLDNKTKNT